MKIVFIFLLISLFLAGCANMQTNNQKPIIAVSSYPMYDYVKNIVDAEDFEIWLMLPAGLNAHSYEPTPQDMVKLSKSDVFVYTTDYFEVWGQKSVKSINNPQLLPILASTKVTLLQPDDETLGPIDPHTWLSPKNAKLQVEYISSELIKKYPSKNEKIELKTNEYLQQLTELDQKYEKTTQACKHRDMIVSHAAFGYLARHYNLNQIPVIKNFDPQGEVSLSDLTRVIEAAKAVNASHIFFEDFISPKLSEAVAKEINGKTAIFSPMEAYSVTQLHNDSYIKVMERNLETMKEALNCD